MPEEGLTTAPERAAVAAVEPALPGDQGAIVVKLELGGGKKNLGPPWVNVDIEPGPTVDVVLDFERHPLPYADDSVAEVYSAHCLEHLRNHRPLLNEICRVCPVGAPVQIRLPHWLGPLVMTVGHYHTISDHEVGLWTSHPECFFTGRKKLVEDRPRRHYQPEVYFHEFRPLFPKTFSDELLQRLIPGCCHEVHYFFTVQPFDGGPPQQLW
jgi:predicted SAM-dependent methyltransferase